MSEWRVLGENGEPVFESDSVSVAHTVAVMEIYGADDWAAADPRSGPKALAAWVALALAQQRKLSLPEAQQLVIHMSLQQLRAQLEVANGTGN